MKRITSWLVVMMLSVAAEGKLAIVDNIKYEYFDDTSSAQVVGFQGAQPTGVLEIPGSIDVETDGVTKSYKVTNIYSHSFEACGGLTSVSLPQVTRICDYAFQGCYGLKSVSMPAVTAIEKNAFSGCLSLVVLRMPSVTSIGEAAFFGCLKLSSVVCGSSVPLVAEQAFKSTTGVKIFYPKDAVGWEPLPSPSVGGGSQLSFVPYEEPGLLDDLSSAQPIAVMSVGSTMMACDEYKEICALSGVTPQPEPQVVKEGEIAVTKESIQAAKAETVQIANGVVYLGVSVLSNSDITASTAWAPVKFPAGTQIGLTADGTKLVIPVPAAAQSGFMVLQSGNAKAVPSDGAGRFFRVIVTEDGQIHEWAAQNPDGAEDEEFYGPPK